MIKTRFGYTLLLYLLLPRVIWHLLWRSRKQPEYLERIPERFGRYTQPVTQPLIWVHGVSVGETRAAQPLIDALRKRYPDHRILLTHMTPTGLETGEMLFGDSVTRCYLPYDFPWAVARFLDYFKPRIGLLMETEIWSNLIHGCVKRAIPIYLVNARLSDKSFRRYARFPEITRESLRELTGIAAQTSEDAQRLGELGAAGAVVTGNLKFDITPPPAQVETGTRWRNRYGAGRLVLLAASTRDGEEALLLDVLDQIAVPNLLLVIVPRHPQRFDDIAALLERRSVAYQRRSKDEPIAPGTRVLLGDSMGEMFAYYAACDLAFIGGSLLPYGAQNMIEAAASGKPALIGPSTYNFAEAAEQAIAAGAAVKIEDAIHLAHEAQRLLGDPERMRAMSDAARAFVGAHQGATGRIVQMVRF